MKEVRRFFGGEEGTIQDLTGKKCLGEGGKLGENGT